ncbi:MAG: hypothetical protein AAGC85_07015 [Bacteroidota bacterium]
MEKKPMEILPKGWVMLIWAMYLATPMIAQSGRIAVTEKNGYHEIYLENEPEITALQDLGQGTKASWGYFWETGDGNFSREKVLRYNWDGKTPTPRIKLHLTPRYSIERTLPKTYEREYQLTRSGGNQSTLTYEPKDRIEGNLSITPNHLLVPGHLIRLAIQYKVPSRFKGKETYLVFAMNHNNEPANKVFSLISNGKEGYPTSHFGERPNQQGLLKVRNGHPDVKFMDYFRDVITFRIPTEDAGPEIRRCFLSVMPSKKVLLEELQNMAVLEQEFKETTKEYKLAAALISTDPSVRPEVFKLDLPLFTSQDPNKIYAADKVIPYEGQMSDTLLYKITFSNFGKADENEVTLKIPLPEDLAFEESVTFNPDLLKNSFNLPFVKDTLCLEPCIQGEYIKTYGSMDTLIFTLRDIRLEGVSRGQRRITKFNTGEVIFPIRTPNWKEPSDKISLEAEIIFSKSGEKPIKTGQTNVFYRRFNWGLKFGAGYALNEDLGKYRFSDGQRNSYWAGLTFSTNPIRTGWSWESELSWHYMQVGIDADRPVYRASQPAYQGSILSMDTELDLHQLNVLVQRRLHINNWLGIGIGGGYSLLMYGQAKVDGTLQTAEGDYQASTTANFGLANWNTSDDVLSFGESGESYELLPNPAILQGGAIALADVRLGWVNKGFALGGRYVWRFQNELYDSQLANRSWIEAYLMFSLTRKMK